VEDGTTAVLEPDGTAPSRARYSNFFVKQDGQWLLASVREAAYVPPSNYENLRGLEWVIGEWVDENPGGARLRRHGLAGFSPAMCRTSRACLPLR
jgi:hypothetical protein